MIGALRSTVRTAVKRLGADPVIVIATAFTIFLAAVLLASGPIYADAITVGALQRRLANAPVPSSNVDVETDLFVESYDAVDDLVRETASQAFPGAEISIFSHLEAESYGIESAGSDGPVDLVSFEFFESIETRAMLVAGEWPEGGDDSQVSVALSRQTANALGLGVGDRLSATSRRDPSRAVSVVVSGIFIQNEPGEAYWLGEELTRSGVIEAGGFRTYGPFIVSRADVSGALATARIRAGWHVLPHFETIDVDEVDAVRAHVSDLAFDLDRRSSSTTDAGTAGLSDFNVSTDLPSLLSDTARSLVVTRSSILALLIQLAVLAGYGLVLTSGLLADARRSETELLRSRGMSPGQIAGVSLVEGLILTTASVLAAPLVASSILRALNRVGPLAAVGLSIEPGPNPEAYMLAAIAAIGSIVALVWPAWRSARSSGRNTARHRREPPRPRLQTVGLDIALLTIAGVVIWQLTRLGPQAAATVRGRFGVDPLLIIAPAVGLVAGAILALRIVPLLARAGEWIVGSRRSTTAALASWQLARRPLRYARSSLLLMMAVGIGFFAAAYTSTWGDAQQDQAAHSVGSDFAVIPDRSSDSIPDFFLRRSHLSIPGVEASMPLLRTSGRISSTAGSAQFLILDAATAGQVVAIRPDLSPDFAKMMTTLVQGRPDLPGVPIPGEPTHLGFDVNAVERPEKLPDGTSLEPAFAARVRVTLQDGDGLLHRFDVGEITPDQGRVHIDVQLQAGASGGDLIPTYPLRLFDIELETRLATDASRQLTLTMSSFEIEEGGEARPLPIDGDPANWETIVGEVPGAHVFPSISPTTQNESGSLSWVIGTGLGSPAIPGYITVKPRGEELPDSVPIVVSEGFPAVAFADVGDEISLSPLHIAGVSGLIVGKVSAFPGLDLSVGEGAILDLPTFQALRHEADAPMPEADVYWLRASGDSRDLTARLAQPPLDSFEVTSRELVEDGLMTDPVALGVIGALFVGFVAATAFAAVGLAANALVSARERAAEFALLRAVGLSPTQIRRWLAIEQSVLVGVSLILGTLIGLIVATVILPLVALTPDGGPAVPPVLIDYPWLAITVIEGCVVLATIVAVTLLTRLASRVSVAEYLRTGEI